MILSLILTPTMERCNTNVLAVTHKFEEHLSNSGQYSEELCNESHCLVPLEEPTNSRTYQYTFINQSKNPVNV